MAFNPGGVRDCLGLRPCVYKLLLFVPGNTPHDDSFGVYEGSSFPAVFGVMRLVFKLALFASGLVLLVPGFVNPAPGIVPAVSGNMEFALGTVYHVNRFVHYVFKTV